MYEIFEKLCAKRGITPYKFCKDTGVNTSTISTWKKNNSLARPELAKKVCEYFDVSLDYLMGNNFIKEMGHIIQEERIHQGMSQEELANAARIFIGDLISYEDDNEPIREDIFNDIASALGTNYFDLLDKYGLYDEYIPSQFDGNIAKFESFKKAVDKDVQKENAETENDILIISRVARKMTPENRKKLIEMARIMFKEDFDD